MVQHSCGAKNWLCKKDHLLHCCSYLLYLLHPQLHPMKKDLSKTKERIASVHTFVNWAAIALVMVCANIWCLHPKTPYVENAFNPGLKTDTKNDYLGFFPTPISFMTLRTYIEFGGGFFSRPASYSPAAESCDLLRILMVA